MTTYIFFFNSTSFNFVLKDLDGNFFGNIDGVSSYSLKLNYSDNFQKQYNLTSGSILLSFWLNINGEVVSVSQSVQPYLQIGLLGLRPAQNKITILPGAPGTTFGRGAPQNGFTHIVPGQPHVFSLN
jgi:hypothetical protein